MNLSFAIMCVSDFNYHFPKVFTLKTNRGDITYQILQDPIKSIDGGLCVFRDYSNIPKFVKSIREHSDVPCILATNKKDQLYHVSLKNTLYMDKIILRDMLLELSKAMMCDYDLHFT